MLSLKSGKKIAMIDNDKKDCIYLKDDKGGEAEIQTSFEQKVKMLEKYLKLDKRLRQSEIELMKRKYRGESIELPDKLFRIYETAAEAVDKSLKKELDYGNENDIFPLVEDDRYAIYITGLSSSGKSHFCAEFLKKNPPKKNGSIFLFSPVVGDKSLEKVKNLIHVSLEECEAELKRDFMIEDIPENSVCVFDDVESFHKDVKKQYLDLRDALLERGRHRNISMITISHNAMNGNTTKTSIREAIYWVMFPKYNARDCRAILKTYGGLETRDINRVLDMNSRWVFYRKSVPKYAVGNHSVIAFD